MAFIKQVPISTHRTLYKTFGARHPSSVTPRWGAPASPRGKPRGRCTNSPGILQNRDCLLQPLSRCGGSSPFRGAFSRCPLWGKCRAAAKGVPLVILTCYHSTNHTPSVSLTLDSSPTGEPSLTSPERFSRCSHSQNGVQLLNAKLRRRIAPEGFPAVRRIPFKMHQGESVPAPLASPGGKLALSAALRNR